MLPDTATDTRLHPWQAIKAIRRLLADPGDIILTSDPTDLAALIEARGITASVHAV